MTHAPARPPAQRPLVIVTHEFLYCYHLQHPDNSDIPLSKKEKKFMGYYKISRHYKWALGQIFHKMNYDVVVIVEGQ